MGVVWREVEGWRERAEALRVRRGLDPMLAMLCSREDLSEEALASYLDPNSIPWPEPLRIPGAAEAAVRLARAVREGEKVLVHGDYDVDGLMGTAVLVGGLKALGGRVEAFVPSRFDGGYGLSEASLQAVRKAGATLVVTTDCGTNAGDIWARLRETGVELLVTDHHIPSAEGRPGGVVVNPKLVAGHPDSELCGAAVALQVLRAVAAEMGNPLPLEPFVRLVAIATIADVVPLTPVNRKICKAGFAALEDTPNPGLALLLEDILKMGPVRGHHISYHVAPRFNAAGRMESARLVLDLLLERDPGEASRLRGRLESLNSQRKALQLVAFEEALEQAGAAPEGSRVVFAASASWHKGVIGPVAARLAETFRKSAFVVCVEGESGVGSGRAWRQDNVSRMLGEASDLLIRFGGHSGAAGFSVRTDLIPELARRLASLSPAENEGPRQEVYYPIEPSMLGEAWRVWGILDPFGPENPEPYLALTGLCPKGQKTLTGGHLSWDVGVPGSVPIQFISWNGQGTGLGPASLAPSRMVIGRPSAQSRPGGPPYYFNIAAIL